MQANANVDANEILDLKNKFVKEIRQPMEELKEKIMNDLFPDQLVHTGDQLEKHTATLEELKRRVSKPLNFIWC